MFTLNRINFPALLLGLRFTLAACLLAVPACVNAKESDSGFWERLGRATKLAASSPRTWAPLLGAAALHVNDSDRRLQVWAAEHTPLFGSQENADRISDNLKDVANGLWITSALLPWQDEAENTWLQHKAEVMLVEVSANMTNSATVGLLKERTARQRPNGAGYTSFPSDHAARAALHTGMTRSNLNHLGWSEQALGRASVGLDTITWLTAWARVEANQHYPSDVLAGMAIGNFIGMVFTGTFLESGSEPQPQVILFKNRESTYLQINWVF